MTVADQDWTGRRLRLRVGPVAHGGHCVARHEGRVVFVRHAVPGELVVAEVTEDRGGSFCRADAVEVVEPSPDRVEPPCRYAHPGGCGGCDFQHVAPARQRALKAEVVAEQLSRLAGLDRPVEVEPLGEQSLGWRRRIRYAVDRDGRLGLHGHRSGSVVPVRRCLLGAPGVGDAEALGERWRGLAEVELAVDDDGATALVGYRRPPRRGRQRPGLRIERTEGAEELHYRAAGREFALRPAGFWQTHPAAAGTFSQVVLAEAAAEPGERALDLYAGAGLFTAALAGAVGDTGRVLGLEGDPAAAGAAAANLADLPWAEVARRPVNPMTVARTAAVLRPSAVVLDPPRTGAGRDTMIAILAAAPRVVVYVACDPAALARDLRVALDAGWRLAGLRAFDAYPMTHHVECIATLRPA
ncbi:MAG TPA: TRAM domain-containing protein [Jatrophihabitans sp.]|nr:TRAM domain-containing protein [Jatrophihabitans sp.]